MVQKVIQKLYVWSQIYLALFYLRDDWSNDTLLAIGQYVDQQTYCNLVWIFGVIASPYVLFLWGGSKNKTTLKRRTSCSFELCGIGVL